ncbi:hypothetical protein K2Z83_25305 [Oscillochloris sp. ZM17-4]|uniref:hypothetical protein n=1 Tax=Oscillochloris sp. ZM17-4 TaxID=2866714 RepID=UPI001C736C0F|nr:hypothetical protein [Oscillochloris sp. ZM17-4]MBX0330976.1 hypothetical protein [Oscillochloris sp. ZM17-4]
MSGTASNLRARQVIAIDTEKQIGSFLFAIYACLLVLIGFIAASDRIVHWFVIPVTLCGVVVGIDAFDWFRNKCDIFDPYGLTGVFGVFFFFLAPLLHVYWDRWLPYIVPPNDWREWLGYMATLNLLGLMVYRFSRGVFLGRHYTPCRPWLLDERRFFFLGLSTLMVTAAAQILVYMSYGGIQGYIEAATNQDTLRTNMRYMGWIYSISESFPIIAMMMFGMYARDKPRYRSWAVLITVLVVYFLLKIFFGGLRGSRNNTIWGLIWGVGILHIWVRPFSKPILFAGLAFMIVFMYFYGFYKNAGLDSLQAFGSASNRSQLEQVTRRDTIGLILGDLGRSDIQAFELYRILKPDSDYDLAYGRTYMVALMTPIPRSIIERPATKTYEGSLVQWGKGQFVPSDMEASNLYGLTGEAMLNFGPVVVPLMFVFLGLANGLVKRWRLRTSVPDARLLIYPFITIFCFYILACDLDNIIFDSTKNLLVPVALIVASLAPAVRQEREAARAQRPLHG